MNLICKITDKDIGKQPIEMDNPRLRLGARGIVIREDGKIAQAVILRRIKKYWRNNYRKEFHKKNKREHT